MSASWLGMIECNHVLSFCAPCFPSMSFSSSQFVMSWSRDYNMCRKQNSASPQEPSDRAQFAMGVPECVSRGVMVSQ